MTSVVFSFLLKVAPRAAKASKPNTQAAVSLWQRFLRGSEEEGEESLEVWLNTLGAGGESPLDPTQPASPQARRELQDFITNMRRLPVSRPFQVETAATRNPSLLRASWPPNAEDLRVPSQWGEPAMVHLPQ